MRFQRPAVNHGGTSPDNPVLSGMALSLRLSKHGSSETLRQCWVTVGDLVFKKITGLAVISEFEIVVPVTAGTHLQSGFPAVKNIVHFTTSDHRHAQAVVYCADIPPVMITLDGYDGSNWQRPLIYPLLNN